MRRGITSWALTIVGSLVGLVLLVLVIGSFLPKSQFGTRTLILKQPPEAVWQVLTDYPRKPSWQPDVKRFERLADRNGHEVWMEVHKSGARVVFETIESHPPRRLVWRVPGDYGPFRGLLVVEITPIEGGCRVTFTQEGEVPNPFYRFLVRFLLPLEGFLEADLKALAAKFGETAVIE